MERDRRILHLQQTAVKFRHKSARRSRGAFSPRRDLERSSSDHNLYRFEVYGNKDEISCFFMKSKHGDHHRNFYKPNTKTHKQKAYWRNEENVAAAKPVSRVQSAPRKLSYLDKKGSRRSKTDTDTGRPQTVAPFVRDIVDIGQNMPSRVTAVDRSSDKHSKESPLGSAVGNYKSDYTYHCATSFEKALVKNDSENNGVGYSRIFNVLDIDVNKHPRDERTFNDSSLENTRGQLETAMNTSERKLRVTFASSPLSDTNYAPSEQANPEQKEHEEAVEKLRQSFGIDVDSEQHVPTTKFCEIPQTKSSFPMELINSQNKHIKSTRQRAALTEDGSRHGHLTKPLREQRSKTNGRHKRSPIEEIEQKLLTMETERPKRNVAGLLLRSITFIRYVCQLFACMIDLSAEVTTRSATEEQWHALHTSREARDMAFNKAAFAKRKDDTRVPIWAKKVMRKDPEDRTEQEVKRVHALLRGMKSFDRFTEKIQLSMCKSFIYYRITSGRVILRQGHIGQNFYFLFNGSVFVNIDDVDTKGNRFSKTEAILCRGDSFGELALLQDIRRTATITCREDCEMLVVDKDTFARICPRIFELELDEKMRFASKMKLFNLRIWDEESMRKMCFEAQIQEYKTNKVVVVDSEKDEWIYICMEGKCEVIRRMDLCDEIRWRKRDQRQGSGKMSRRHSRPDYLTVMTGLSNPSLDAKERRSRSVNPVVKQNLLDSMGLEFVRKRGLQQMRERRSSKGDLASSLRTKGGYGPLTLTSLLANDEKQNGNHLFLNIHTMKEYDVFDISSVLKSRQEIDQSNGSHILVSLGSRLMRIKRTSYFAHASADAIELAKGLALKYMYPTDDILLQRYRDILQWEVYKYRVLEHALSNKPKSNCSDSNGASSRALFKLNKSTLIDLDSILCNEDESTKEAGWKRIEELNSRKPTDKRINHQNEQSSKLPSLKQEQPQGISVETPKGTTEEELKPVQRRPSKLIPTEFKTIVEIDEQE